MMCLDVLHGSAAASAPQEGGVTGSISPETTSAATAPRGGFPAGSACVFATGQNWHGARKALAASLPRKVAVDARSNSLILSAQSETLDLAAKIVADLDKSVDRFVTEVKLFRLKHASALRMVPLLQSVFAEGPPVPGTDRDGCGVRAFGYALDRRKGHGRPLLSRVGT